MLFQRQHAEHGRVTSGADRHRLAGSERFGQRYQPVTLDPRHLGQAAPMGFANAPAIEDYLIASFPLGVTTRRHRAGKIDPRNHGKAAHNR